MTTSTLPLLLMARPLACLHTRHLEEVWLDANSHRSAPGDDCYDVVFLGGLLA
ncbi:hypothetical protein AB1484_31060 [Parafrankia sp. FMc6]|uniref:hypothetical protein n=1 Tax=Parafrankia soli TaxID=2599596 RepID=UPI0034D73DDB